MPYIPKKDRDRYNPHIKSLLQELHISNYDIGHINYIFTLIIINIWKAFPRYATIASIRGMLSDVKDEFYRRYASRYEDKKIEENGDVK